MSDTLRYDRMRSATLRQLRAFTVVARNRSFVRAAAELHLTPSAVSLQMKELEGAIGIPLFSRNGKGVALTESGEVLLVYVRKALQLLKEADEALTRLNGPNPGLVAVGIASNAKYFLPRLLASFRQSRPEAELRVSVANRMQLVRQLCDGEVDLAIMGAPPREIETRAEAFAPQPLGIIASPRHPLAGRQAIPVELLEDYEFIVREPGSGTRAAMENFFREANVAPMRTIEMGSNETIKQAVIENMGLAFLSLHTVGLEIRTGHLVPLDVAGLPLMRRWYVVTHGGKPPSPPAEDLRQFIIRDGGRLIAEHFALAATAPAGAAPGVVPAAAQH